MNIAYRSPGSLGVPVYRWLWGCTLALMALPSVAQEASSPVQARDEAVAQVILGILSYTRWPDDPSTLRLCIVGPTQQADAIFEGAADATGVPLQVERLPANEPGLPERCNAVYLGQLSDAEQAELTARLLDKPILTISEQAHRCDTGVLFCLVSAGQRVAFEAQLDAVTRSGLRIHPSVLQLSRSPAVQP